MKFQKITIFPFALIILLATACSSEDSPKDEQEQEINPANQKLVSITYPTSSNLAYMNDKQEYQYDDLSRIKLNGAVEIKYVSDDLIETNLLEDNMSNVDLEAKTFIKLKEKNIVSFIGNRVFKKLTGEVTSIDRDSTVISYENGYLFKLVTYFKSITTGSTGKYYLQKQIDFTITNGNITQTKTTEYGDVVVTNYTYDSSPYIPMGDFGYETPLHKVGLIKPLFYNKLGKSSANNIIKIENVFTKTPFQKSYKTISFKRNFDKYGRISEILLSGSCVTSNPDNVATDFTDEKVLFEYK